MRLANRNSLHLRLSKLDYSEPDTDFVVKINLILILSLLTNICAFAQKDYYPGFVVTNMGDTILGKAMDRKYEPAR